MTAINDNRPLPVPAGNWALFLDIDGTLLDIAATPSSVTVPPHLPGDIRAIAEVLDGALALVSGRPLRWIDSTFAPLRLPAAGEHGAELRLTGDALPQRVELPEDLALARRQIAARVGHWPGVMLEAKTFGVAVHFRLAPYRGPQVRDVLREVADSMSGRFDVMPGNMVFELKLRGPDKGQVVAAFMAVPPFAGRVPVFVGDDRTDEDGFREVLSRGGYAVQVGPGASALASCAVPDPQSLRDWLRSLPGVLRGAVA